MFMLTGRNEQNEVVILDDKIPDDFAAAKTAEECGEYYPGYHDFVLSKIENEGANEEQTES